MIATVGAGLERYRYEQRISRLTETVHSMALSMVSLEYRIRRAEILGRTGLVAKLKTRREGVVGERSDQLVELIIERQLGTGKIC